MRSHGLPGIAGHYPDLARYKVERFAQRLEHRLETSRPSRRDFFVSQTFSAFGPN
jgi:hypothetical protein